MTKYLDEYYMWTEINNDGSEGSIAAFLPQLGTLNLITRNYEIASTMMRDIAVTHNKVHGTEVRLVRWTKREDLEVISATKKETNDGTNTK